MKKLFILILFLGAFSYFEYIEASAYSVKQIVCWHDNIMCPNGNATITYSINNGTLYPLLGAKVDCGNGQTFKWQSSNSTWICSNDNGATDTNTAQISNADHAGSGLFGSRLNATANTIKSLSAGTGISLGGNSTDVSISTSALLAALTSLNGDTTGAQLIKANSALSNLTITDSGATHSFKLGQAVVILNGSKQIFTKNLDFGQGTTQTFPNTGTVIRGTDSKFAVTIKPLTQTLNLTAQIFSIKSVANFTMSVPLNYTSDVAALHGVAHGCVFYDNTVNNTARFVCILTGASPSGSNIKVLAKN